jgi:hypothetical protein
MTTWASDARDPRLYKTYRNPPGRHEGILRSLRRLLAGTAQEELEAAEECSQPATLWLREMWTQAQRAASQARWQSIPEDIFDQVDDEHRTLVSEDLSFFVTKAASPDSTPIEAVAAIRLLGLLAEDGYAPLNIAVGGLVDAVQHRDPRRRLHAAEALWQAQATEALPVLEQILCREKVPDVAATIRHTISILR